MKKKYLILFSIASFLMGIAVSYFLKIHSNIKMDSNIEKIVNDEVEDNRRVISLFKEALQDSDSVLYMEEIYTKKAIKLIETTEELRKQISNNTLSEHTFNELLDIVKEKEEILVEANMDFSLTSAIYSIKSQWFTCDEKIFRLNIIENYFLRSYIEWLNSTTLPFSYGEVINIAERDTVRLGDTYRSKLIFSVTDILGNKRFENISQGRVENGFFEDKALKSGKNHVEGMFWYKTIHGADGFKVDFDYYVQE